MPKKSKTNVPLLLSSILLSQLAGAIGSIFTASSIPTWYATLTKPFFNPPNWLFGPVWITLYTLMGIALYIVWNKANASKKKNYFPVWLFLAHLVINTLWSIIFFGVKDLLAALLTIFLLWGMIFALIKMFYKIEKKAAYLLYPYLAWVSFATLLNAALLLLN
ncbi:MAG: TspO protein [Candidatus Pacebacteria bacterium CG_4_9_14_3_um_filter_40_12]|nr:MAG: TspO protein [Candidatus Pacebacteria bacterium CG10_big_fil_rev_8_21_14_0_10_40_26]PIZ78272.1 MAG: TspO protein [Candidatus Pacebacteria bacterium CG_4_10_14_0_2_um_filter_40_20]PJA68683.1 MAG: TspO protein [Candidatus Pacebacteria bacterium CG_4_9_14_3_um_filter_40_12]PJC41623.1 MAG: TspO protein [Candidatus Pacebacteria bacterium CG_4_9_14_0_2_um_filter_40_15]